MLLSKKQYAAGAAIVAALTIGATAAAVPVRVTVTNTSPTDSLRLTPVVSIFHDGSYDTFDVGSSVQGTSTEIVAELGNPMPAIADAQAAGAAAGAVLAPGGFPGAPVIEPGETGTLVLDIDPTSQRFFSYLSMVIPSNDQFIGNGDPQAFEIFDAFGNFNGPVSFTVTGDRVWDAGTEVNDFTDGPAFVASVDGVAADAAAGTVENGVVTQSTGLGLLNGQIVALPGGLGFDINEIGFANDSAFSIATFSIDLAPVPVPAALPLMAAALGGGAFLRRRKKQAAA